MMEKEIFYPKINYFFHLKQPSFISYCLLKTDNLLNCRINQKFFLYLFYNLVTKKENELMKETKLGEFEEVLLLLVGILDDAAYAFKIAEEFESQTGRAVSIGSVHSTLNRLSDKGFLKSEMGEPSAIRGGRRKRIYEITAYGDQVLRAARNFKMNLWDQFPGLAFTG